MNPLLKLGSVILLPALLAGCAELPNKSSEPANQMYQVSTLGAVAQGVYGGDYTYGQLFSKGTMGLGTFKGLDGEMVAVDGNYYQIRSTGKLTKVRPDQIVPFAEVVNFKPETVLNVSAVNSYHNLQAELKPHFSKHNLPYAIKIEGFFPKLHLRSPHKQHKPYPKLVDAVKDQAIFDLKDRKGTLVGFWFPQYWNGIAVPGFHLHFVSEDQTIGGHVLGLSMAENAKVEIAPIHNLTFHLPDTKEFSAVDLNPEPLSGDIKKAESSK